MKVFVDIRKRSWDIQLTVGGVIRIKEHCQIDLGNIMAFAGDKNEPGVLERLGDDAELLCKTIWLLCEKQAEKRAISQQDFFDSLDGDSIEAAADALIDEIINFTRPAQRKVLMKLRALSREAELSLEKKLDTVLNSPEFANEVCGTLTKSSGASPES